MTDGLVERLSAVIVLAEPRLLISQAHLRETLEILAQTQASLQRSQHLLAQQTDESEPRTRPHRRRRE
jgi:hypothetical protein